MKSRDFLNEETLKNLQKAKRKSSRVATEGDNPEIYNECAYFPPVKKRYNFGKSPILERFPSIGKE